MRRDLRIATAPAAGWLDQPACTSPPSGDHGCVARPIPPRNPQKDPAPGRARASPPESADALSCTCPPSWCCRFGRATWEERTPENRKFPRKHKTPEGLERNRKSVQKV